MKVKSKNIIILLVVGLNLVSCENTEHKIREPKKSVLPISLVQKIPSPANIGSSTSDIIMNSNGDVYLTWTEIDDKSKASLYFSVLKEGNWQSPVKIDEGTDWVVNWADFPTLAQFGDSSLVVNYLVVTVTEL